MGKSQFRVLTKHYKTSLKQRISIILNFVDDEQARVTPNVPDNQLRWLPPKQLKNTRIWLTDRRLKEPEIMEATDH